MPAAPLHPAPPKSTHHPTPARHRIADDEVIARNVGKAAEVRRIGEAVAAGGEALVAAGGHGETVADAERFGRALPQLDQHAVERDAVRLHLDREAFARAARERQLAARERAIRERDEAGRA